MTPAPFSIAVPDGDIADLRERLRRTRWPDEVADSGWTYGADLAYLRELARYWAEAFDWRAHERELNRLPQFRMDVGGCGIHFIQAPGRGPKPLPLLVTHGWPGSFAELRKIVPLLADPAAHGGDPRDAFDVVAPSLPGFGFSDPATSPGMSTRRMAGLFAELMRRLGYERFGAQGGDFAAGVATALGLDHAARLAGLHFNYVPGSYRPDLSPPAPPLTEEERRFEADVEAWYEEEGGYAHQQMTRPQTLSVGLNDSPAGLLAWIVEKFRAWGDCAGDVESRFSKDDLLVNVSIYWFTRTIASSNRLYFEGRKVPYRFRPGERVAVPCAIARFPLEAPFPPRSWIERGYDVARWTEMPRGGHFPALEEPALLVEDVRAFFRGLR